MIVGDDRLRLDAVTHHLRAERRRYDRDRSEGRRAFLLLAILRYGETAQELSARCGVPVPTASDAMDFY